MRESLYDYCIANGKEHLLEQWHIEKNGELTPYNVPARTRRKVWWKCGKDHEWEATIESRTRVAGCPVCANRVVIAGENDLATSHPHLAAQWNYEKNAPLTPQQIPYGTIKKVWWRCEKGHEWQAGVNYRVRGTGCPVCDGKIVIPGENDFASAFPELAAQWHPTKNGDLRPCDVTRSSGRKVWWICEKGHEWQAVIQTRAKVKTGCPICGKKTVLRGTHDLTSAFPDIAAQWHPTKNGDLRPQDVAPYSARKVWWRCEKGHEWQVPVMSRTKANTGCPYCANRKVLPGFNDLATTNPDVAAQWHPTKNGDLTSQMVMAGSHQKVWWVCEKGHESQAMVQSRTKGDGCPVCAGRIVIPGENDLASVFPDVAAQWHPTKNGDLRPCDVIHSSGRRVWWMCEKGHEWQAIILHRAKGGRCPVCSGRGSARRQPRDEKMSSPVRRPDGSFPVSQAEE